MLRKKLPNSSEYHNKHLESIGDLSDKNLELSHTELVERAGGSISNLPVQTKEFGDWITEQRKLNPLIGKSYIEPAHEYNSEQIKLNDETTLLNTDAENFVKHETNKALNVEESQKIMSDSKDGDTHDIKFIDMTIIENTTAKMLSYDKEEIIKVTDEELQKYHNDTNYKTEIDSDSIINTTQQFLLAQENNNKLLK